jgi:hypothetical protein
MCDDTRTNNQTLGPHSAAVGVEERSTPRRARSGRSWHSIPRGDTGADQPLERSSLHFWFPSNQPSGRLADDIMTFGVGARIIACVVLFLSSWSLVACGGSTNPSSSTTPHPTTPAPAAATATTTAASPPPGGAAPARLVGTWTRVIHTADEAAVVTIDTNSFSVSDTLGGASGEIVVNGNEIDFFNVPQCHLFLPKGVGRYRWRLRGATLHFTALNSDPCPVRHGHFANQNFTRTGG